MSDKPRALVDTECYRDYWLCLIRRLDDGRTLAFEQYPGKRLDVRTLKNVLSRVTSITYNGNSYDMPMIALALTGADCEALKRASDEIILTGLRRWDFERTYKIQIPAFDHIDLIEVKPTKVSLKICGGRLHTKRLQDLPIEPDAYICDDSPIEHDGQVIRDPAAKRELLRWYCGIDLDNTGLLAKKFAKQIELREQMSIEYGADLRSKSDAQIAETVLREKISTLVGWRVKAPDSPVRQFQYKAPEFLQYAGDIVKPVVDAVCASTFYVQPNGKVEMPAALEGRSVQIGSGVYRMGIGGLHSREKSTAHLADDEWMLIDRDVASYYPAIVIETGLYPRHLGKHFLHVYRDIRAKRIDAKRAGNKTVAETLKIVLNGAFGKLGSPYSVLYSPDLLIQVTLTGQLALLMLIERIQCVGDWAGGIMSVVSANTDGIVIKCRRDRYDTLQRIISTWEQQTKFETEETRYRAVYSRDVNNYIAIKDGGGVKLKGAYSPPEPVASSWPSPRNQVVLDAVCWHLEWGFDIEGWIRDCNDPRQFVELRTVKGGGTWRGRYLGKAVRWIKSRDGEPIHYRNANKKGNHNKVAGTDGCRPVMELPEALPEDIDFDAYVNEANGILREIGYSG